MSTVTHSITEALHAEIDQVPEERRALLLRLVHSFREGVEQEIEDIDPTESIRRGLADIRAGRVYPIETLWDGIKSA